MSVYRYLLVNDIHLASKGPSTRVDDWHKTVARKLNFIEKMAEDFQVDGICNAGDLFHAESIAYKSGEHGPMREALVRFKYWNDVWGHYAIPGNHDLPHNRLDMIPQSAFGVAQAAAAFHSTWEGEFGEGRARIFTKDGCAGGAHYPKTVLWIYGVPYPATEEDIKFAASFEGPGIMMVHAFASMSGGEIHGETNFSYVDLTQWVPNARVWHFGHDHSDKGVVTLGNTIFVQVGSLLRGTLADDQISRQPKIVMVELTDDLTKLPTYIEIPVPIEKAEVVFDLSVAEVVPSMNDAIDEFVAHVGTVTSEQSPEKMVVALDETVSPAVRDKVQQYLMKAGSAK